MKRLFLILTLIFGSALVANHDLYKIERLVEPYEKAIEFVVKLDLDKKVDDHEVYVFFQQYDLYEKKDVTKFNRIVRTVKKLTYSKKTLRDYRQQLELLIDTLQKVQYFIMHYSAMHYALLTYYEIAARYYYIDEQHADIVNLIIQQSDKLGLPDMCGRGLYKFGKQIDCDVRRLSALFLSIDPSLDFLFKINTLKTKLVLLAGKFVGNAEYKAQLSKTRWLKAFAFLGLPLLIFGAYGALAVLVSVDIAELMVVPCLIAWAFLVDVIANEALYEAYKYKLPVTHTMYYRSAFA